MTKVPKRSAYTVEITAIRKYYGLSYTQAQKRRSKMPQTERDGVIAAVERGEKAPENVGPFCPSCGGSMVQRTSQWGDFWGCAEYPTCRGIRKILNEAMPTAEQKKENAKKMNKALKFIEDLGGVDNARKWLNIATRTLSEM